jgi:hypothetical protein
MLTVNVFFAGRRDFDVDDTVFVVDCMGETSQAGHVNACVEDREKREVGQQEESWNSVVVNLGVHSDAELGKGTLKRDKKEDTAYG